MYYRPFQKGLWVALGVPMGNLVVFYVLWDLAAGIGQRMDVGRVFLVLLSYLVEDCHPNKSEQGRCGIFRITFGSWFLLSTVLSGGYIGTVINWVNVRPPQRRFDECSSLPCLDQSP